MAFANIWPGPDGEELSIDLMRYHRDAPEERDGGAVRAPDDRGARSRATGGSRSAWRRCRASRTRRWRRSGTGSGAFLYEHGEAVYNFQGLRAYKDKFDPVWEPHYLAYPGGLRLPRIIADVSALVAGGYRQIFRK